MKYFSDQLRISLDIVDQQLQASAYNGLGISCTALDDRKQALGYLNQSLEIKRRIKDRRGEGNTLGNIGMVHIKEGKIADAIRCHEDHLCIARELDERYGIASASENLATALLKPGPYFDMHRSLQLLSQTADYRRQIRHPNADEVAARLAALRQILETVEPQDQPAAIQALLNKSDDNL